MKNDDIEASLFRQVRPLNGEKIDRIKAMFMFVRPSSSLSFVITAVPLRRVAAKKIWNGDVFFQEIR